jgi:hypothetical protein
LAEKQNRLSAKNRRTIDADHRPEFYRLAPRSASVLFQAADWPMPEGQSAER